MKSPVISYLLLFFGVFALSTSAIFVKLADAPSSITAFYRMLFAAIFLLPFLVFSKSNHQELLSLTKKQWGLGLSSGLFLATHYALWFESLNYTSVASSTVIVTLQPLFSMLGGYFLFKERFSIGAIIGCLIAIGGSVVIGWQDFQISGEAHRNWPNFSRTCTVFTKTKKSKRTISRLNKKPLLLSGFSFC